MPEIEDAQDGSVGTTPKCEVKSHSTLGTKRRSEENCDITHFLVGAGYGTGHDAPRVEHRVLLHVGTPGIRINWKLI